MFSLLKKLAIPLHLVKMNHASHAPSLKSLAFFNGLSECENKWRPCI